MASRNLLSHALTAWFIMWGSWAMASSEEVRIGVFDDPCFKRSSATAIRESLPQVWRIDIFGKNLDKLTTVWYSGVKKVVPHRIIISKNSWPLSLEGKIATYLHLTRIGLGKKKKTTCLISSRKLLGFLQQIGCKKKDTLGSHSVFPQLWEPYAIIIRCTVLCWC